MLPCSWSGVHTPFMSTLYRSCTSASPLLTHSTGYSILQYDLHILCSVFFWLILSTGLWHCHSCRNSCSLVLFISLTSFFFLGIFSFLFQSSVFLPSASLLLHMSIPMWELKTSLQISDPLFLQLWGFGITNWFQLKFCLLIFSEELLKAHVMSGS